MRIKRALLIGENTSNSLSPIIFNYWFSKYSINGEYNYKEVKKNKLKHQVDKILNNSCLCGLNVTIPFKEEIIQHLDELDEHSKKIGAVNCITIKKNKLCGSNTDWIGYSKILKEKTTKLERINKEAIIVGYGGAAKAILYALLRLEYKKIHIFNRSTNKFKDIKNTNNKVETHPIYEINKYIKSSNLIINTIPTNILEGLGVSKTLPKNVTVSDIVYRPLETKFLRYFVNPKQKIYGIFMLINQAIPCFKKWYGILPAIDEKLLEIINNELNK